MARTALHDLVTVGGQLIRIEMPAKFEDQLLDAIDNARLRGDWWSPNMVEGCSATYMGLQLDRVAMNQIIGML